MSLRSSASYSPSTSRKKPATSSSTSTSTSLAPPSPLLPGSSSLGIASAPHERVGLTKKEMKKNENRGEGGGERTKATTKATARVEVVEGESESETERRKKKEQARSMHMALSSMEHDAVVCDASLNDDERLEGLKKQVKVMKKTKKKNDKIEKKEKDKKKKEKKKRKDKKKAESERVAQEFSSASSASSSSSSSSSASSSSSSTPSTSSLLKHAHHLHSGGLPQPTAHVSSGGGQALVRVLSSPATSNPSEEFEGVKLYGGGGGGGGAPKAGFSLKSSASSAEMLNMISREGLAAVAGAGNGGDPAAGAKRAKAAAKAVKRAKAAAESDKESESDSETHAHQNHHHGEKQQQKTNSSRRLRVVRSDEVPADIISRSASPCVKATVNDDQQPAPASDEGPDDHHHHQQPQQPKKQHHTRLLERERRKRTDSVKRVTVDWDDFVLDEADEENVNILSIAPSISSSASSPAVPTSAAKASASPSSSSSGSPSLAKSMPASSRSALRRSHSSSPTTGRRVHKRSDSVGSRGSSGSGSGSGGRRGGGSHGSGGRRQAGAAGELGLDDDEDEDEEEEENDDNDNDEDADDEFSQSGAAPGMPSFRAATFAKIIEKLVLFAAIKQDEDNSLRIEDDFAFDWNSIREEAISQLSPRSEEEMMMRDREEQERRAREDRERDRENEKRARAREREREREKRERERKEVEREREQRELKARQVRRFNSGDQPAAKPFDLEPSSSSSTVAADKTPRGTSNADKRPLSRSADRRPTVERVKRSEHRRGKSAEDAMAISEAEMKLLADSMLEKRQRQIEEHTRNASRSAENKSGGSSGGGFGSGGLAMTSPPGARRHSKQLSPGGESEMEKSRDKLMFEQAMAIMRLEEAARSASKKPSGKGRRDREKEKEKAGKSPAASASASPTQTSTKQLRSGGSIPTSTTTSTTTGASRKKGELNSGDLSVGAEAKESRNKSSSSKSFDDFAEQKRKEEQRKERQQQHSKRSPGDEKNEGEAEGDKNEAEEKKKKKKAKKEKKEKAKKKKEKTKKVKDEAVDEEAHCAALFDWDSIKEEAMIALPRDGGKAGGGGGGDDIDDKTSSSVAHRTGTLRYMPAGIMPPRPSLSSSVSFPSPSTSPSGAPPTFAFGPASSPDGPQKKKRPTLLELLDVDADADANEASVDNKKAKTAVPPMKRSTTSPGGLTRGDVTQPTRENGSQRRKENEKETKREKDQATEEHISPRAAPTRRRKAAHHHSLERSSPAKNDRNAKLVDSDDDGDDVDGNGDAMIRRHKILRERTKKVINDSRDVDNSGGPVSRQPYSIGTYLSPGPDVDGRRARRLRMANATPIRRRPPTPGQVMDGISGNAREQPTMVEAFVLSYKSIFTPRDLCQALVKRYTTAPPRAADANKIQEGVVSVFEQWINLQVMDFYEDNEVLRLFKASPFKKEHREGLLMLLEQKRKQLRQERFQALAASTSIAAQPVRQSLERPLYRAPGQSASHIYTPRGEPTGAPWDRNGDRGGRGPTTYRPDPRRASRDVGGGFDPNHWMSLSQSLSLSFSSKNLNNKSPWVRIKSSEMAQQMALVEHRLLRAVPNKEWLNVNWTRKAKELLAPNILALSCHFNVMSNWVTYEVLSELRNDARAKLIQKFARIAVKCRQLNNFNGLLEILAGLGNVAVTRLTKTWKDVDPETRRVLKQLDELMSPTHNRRNYRRLEAEAVPPCVPYLGVSLGDLFFIEANEMEISGLVNFEKLEMIGKVIYTLLLFQNVSYQFEPDEGLQAFLASPPQVPDEDSLYSLSLSLQPLEGA